LLDRQGRPYLTDFGIAISGNLAGQRTTDTMGTLRYMAPEQLAETANYRSDIYGLGVVLYELLTGERPFAATDTVDMRNAVVTGQPMPPRRVNPNIPAALERACLRAMAKEPGDRYATATEFAAALRLVSSRRRTTWILGGMAAIAATTVLVFGLWKWQGPADRESSPQSEKDQQYIGQHIEVKARAREKAEHAKDRAEAAATEAKRIQEQAKKEAAAAISAEIQADRDPQASAVREQRGSPGRLPIRQP
jgi:serine/threonine protein kinase